MEGGEPVSGEEDGDFCKASDWEIGKNTERDGDEDDGKVGRGGSSGKGFQTHNPSLFSGLAVTVHSNQEISSPIDEYKPGSTSMKSLKLPN